jgi:hypothetical protein
MCATELIDRIKALPREDQWAVFRFLSHQFENIPDARLFEEFTLIGSDVQQADVSFAEDAQTEALRRG